MAIALVIAVAYLALGLGHVMDDWYTLNHARFDGAWRAGGSDQLGARPVASLVYAGIFGLLHGAIVPATLLMAVANGVSAMLWWRLLALIAPPSVAVGASVAWLALPTTTSMEAWASAANISLALAMALSSLWIAARAGHGRRSALLAGALAGAAVLSYEAVLVLVLPVALALLVCDRGRDVRAATATVVGSSVAFAWTVLHWHPNKRITSFWGDVPQVIPANFTWGIGTGALGDAAGILILAMTALIAAPPLRAHPRFVEARVPMIVGWTILGVGVIPYLKYTYAPLGAGDRANVVSALGGSLVIATTVWIVGRLTSRRGAAALALAGLLVSLHPRWLMMQSWALAGDDARAIELAVRRLPPGADLVVLGPKRVDRNGVTAMQHPDIFEDAVQVILDDPTIRATITTSLEEFEASDGVRIDLRRIIADPEAPGIRR